MCGADDRRGPPQAPDSLGGATSAGPRTLKWIEHSALPVPLHQRTVRLTVHYEARVNPPRRDQGTNFRGSGLVQSGGGALDIRAPCPSVVEEEEMASRDSIPLGTGRENEAIVRSARMWLGLARSRADELRLTKASQLTDYGSNLAKWMTALLPS